eukprot:TRINITY_DN20198_c0_g1_i1.p1 TRINITY_DN20198_c0_g1~~TRINITY_DN20198_c0_g1_i1.p1  ORF type:complete len:698 (+),score=158.00 TRINITY_DN20198_c0_g1_i1:38-2095(+)
MTALPGDNPAAHSAALQQMGMGLMARATMLQMGQAAQLHAAEAMRLQTMAARIHANLAQQPQQAAGSVSGASGSGDAVGATSARRCGGDGRGGDGSRGGEGGRGGGRGRGGRGGGDGIGSTGTRGGRGGGCGGGVEGRGTPLSLDRATAPGERARAQAEGAKGSSGAGGACGIGCGTGGVGGCGVGSWVAGRGRGGRRQNPPLDGGGGGCGGADAGADAKLDNVPLGASPPLSRAERRRRQREGGGATSAGACNGVSGGGDRGPSGGCSGARADAAAGAIRLPTQLATTTSPTGTGAAGVEMWPSTPPMSPAPPSLQPPRLIDMLIPPQPLDAPVRLEPQHGVFGLGDVGGHAASGSSFQGFGHDASPALSVKNTFLYLREGEGPAGGLRTVKTAAGRLDSLWDCGGNSDDGDDGDGRRRLTNAPCGGGQARVLSGACGLSDGGGTNSVAASSSGGVVANASAASGPSAASTPATASPVLTGLLRPCPSTQPMQIHPGSLKAVGSSCSLSALDPCGEIDEANLPPLSSPSSASWLPLWPNVGRMHLVPESTVLEEEVANGKAGICGGGAAGGGDTSEGPRTEKRTQDTPFESAEVARPQAFPASPRGETEEEGNGRGSDSDAAGGITTSRSSSPMVVLQTLPSTADYTVKNTFLHLGESRPNSGLRVVHTFPNLGLLGNDDNDDL